jgi:hypothetical protein
MKEELMPKSIGEILLNEFNDYLVLLSEMSNIDLDRKMLLMENFIKRVKTEKNNKKTYLVRMPNESEYIELDLDLTNVEIKNDFDDEFFINHGGVLIAVKK